MIVRPLAVLVTVTVAASPPILSASAALQPPSRSSPVRWADATTSFEANVGQAPPEVRFIGRDASGFVCLTSDGATFFSGCVETAPIDMVLAGSNPLEPHGLDRRPGQTNRLLGRDSSGWLLSIPTFDRVLCREVYPGVDLVFHADRLELEFDFHVSPGVNASQIRMCFPGMRDCRMGRRGNVVLEGAGGQTFCLRRPLAWQVARGQRRIVACDYVLTRAGHVTFRLGPYDTTRELVIDPVLAYSTYLGGGNDSWVAVAVDGTGSAYVVGSTFVGGFRGAHNLRRRRLAFGGASRTMFVAKLDPSGAAMSYVTYLGGKGVDQPRGIAVDRQGQAYIVGHTASSDFPCVSAVQNAYGGPAATWGSGDAFVVKLGTNGAKLVYSTYLGGSHNDGANGVAVDADGNAFVTGFTLSDDFPTRSGFQNRRKSGEDAFVAKLDPTGSRLLYSTYLSGSKHERARAIALDGAGHAYVAGWTESADFPTADAHQSELRGGSDAFVVKLSPMGTSLTYSTYFGGSATEEGLGVCVDRVGHVVLVGTTWSTDFPIVNGQQSKIGGRAGMGGDGFVAKFDPAGRELLYATYLGGYWHDAVTGGVVTDGSGSIYVAGVTKSGDFPTAGALQGKFGGSSDGFVAFLPPGGDALTFSTYVGGKYADRIDGIAVDPAGFVYVVGTSESADFPTVRALQPSRGRRGRNTILAKIGITERHRLAVAEWGEVVATDRRDSQAAGRTGPGVLPESTAGLIAVLRDGSQGDRGRATLKLGELGPKARSAIPALMSALADENRGIRYLAAVALVRIGADPKPLIPVLASALREPGDAFSTETSWAAWALGQLGAKAEPVVPMIVEQLRAGPGQRRRLILIEALARIGPHAKAAIPVLTTATRDSRPKVRYRAAAALVLAGADPGPLFPILLEVIASRSKETESEAVWASHALTELGKKATPLLSPIIEELPKQRGLVLLNLIETLGKIGPEARAAAPVLRGLLKDNDEKIRVAAEKALAGIEGRGDEGGSEQ